MDVIATWGLSSTPTSSPYTHQAIRQTTGGRQRVNGGKDVGRQPGLPNLQPKGKLGRERSPMGVNGRGTYGKRSMLSGGHIGFLVKEQVI